MITKSGDWLLRERPQRDRTQESRLDAHFSGSRYGRFADARRNAERHQYNIRVVGAELFIPHLFFLDHIVPLVPFSDGILQHLRIDEEGVDDVVFPRVLVTDRRPRLFRDLVLFKGGEIDRLHHLTECAVRKQHRGHPVNIGKIERGRRQGSHFLHGGRSHHNEPQIAVPYAACSLIIVGLRGLDAAESGTTALYVDDEAGQVASGDVGDALTLQRDSGRRA